MNADSLVAHYRAVAAGVKKPVVIYYIPQFTGLPVDVATIVRLSRLPNGWGLRKAPATWNSCARSAQGAAGVPHAGGGSIDYV